MVEMIVGAVVMLFGVLFGAIVQRQAYNDILNHDEEGN